MASSDEFIYTDGVATYRVEARGQEGDTLRVRQMGRTYYAEYVAGSWQAAGVEGAEETRPLVAPREQREQRQQERAEAEDRARALLYEYLTPLQRKSLEERKCFEVLGGITGRRYTILAGGGDGSRAMLLLRGQHPSALFSRGLFSTATKPVDVPLCYTPLGRDWPLADRMLAYYCAVRFNEDDVERQAGWNYLYSAFDATPLSMPISPAVRARAAWFTFHSSIAQAMGDE